MLGKHWVVSGAVLLMVAGAACSDDDGHVENKPSGAEGDGKDGGGTGTSSDSGASSDAGGGEHDGGKHASGMPAPELTCERVVSDSDCDKTLRPIVFVHGTFGSATEISNTALLFGSNGYCQDRFVAVEYNSLGGNPEEQLEALIDKVLADTGFDQVDLAGHSQGTRHACTYLSDETRRAKVAHYLNISGGCDGYGIPTFSLSSENDLMGTPHHAMGDNVEQVTLVDEDHVALSGSKLGFSAMYKYLVGKDPKYTDVQCGDETIVLDGKSVTFGDNEPVAGSSIDVFDVDELDDPRERGNPELTITTDDAGHFHTELKRGVRYEFRVNAADGSLLGYGYHAAFKRSDYLMRFLSASTNPVVAGASTDVVVRNPNHAGVVGRYVAGAFRKDWGNSLKFDGVEVLTDDNAPRSASVVGLFMYDANENGKSDLGAVLPNGSFLLGTDVFLDASEPRWIDVEWTNEEGSTAYLKIPNWPSTDNLISIVLPY
jgi:pimeloyl-ACP methyl ester carboxylesterase